MASHHVFPEMLATISEAKLKEVLSQRTKFEGELQQLLNAVNNERDQRLKVKMLLDRIESVPSMSKIAKTPRLRLDDIRHFVEQAENDPSVSIGLMKQWQATLSRESCVGTQSERYKYSELYCRLTNEWVSVSKQGSIDPSNPVTLIDLTRQEKRDERVEWEKYVFTPLNTNTAAIEDYLKELFAETGSNQDIQAAYHALRVSTQEFETRLHNNKHFSQSDLKWIIGGLLRSDLLTEQKQKQLKELYNDKDLLLALEEHLKFRMLNLDNWDWSSAKEGIPINQRRGLSGRYRFFHDESLFDAIMLRYIGVKWSVFFQSAMTKFRASPGVWKSSSVAMPKEDKLRREHFLGRRYLEAHRLQHFKDEIFLEQLTKEEEEIRGAYDGNPEDGDTRKSSIQISQTLLHTIATEVLMKTYLGEDQVVVKTDFKWFGPTLPHSTIFTVLKFFNVSEKWISFFRKVLEAPVKFAEDGPDTTVRVRKRGTPPSNPLSDVLAEAIFFCMDFAFNRDTGGAILYRMHDDVWMWGQENACVVGWNSIIKFTNLMGLVLNIQKTGSCKIAGKVSESDYQVVPSLPKALPTGEVRWGLFLKLDSKSGRFIIDQIMVDKHISELSLQLDACKSVFDWIQVWNIYAVRFFTTHFGQSANCLGRGHLATVIKTFNRIQASLFRSTGGSVTSTLKEMIKERSKIDDIPDGFLYFPTSLCGLDVKNPFTTPYLLRDNLPVDPKAVLDTYMMQEKAAYETAKTSFEKKPPFRNFNFPLQMSDRLKLEPFMPFEEFSKYREKTSTALLNAYTTLLAPARCKKIIQTGSSCYLSHDTWSDLSAYHQSTVQLHASDMVNRFDEILIAEDGVLPTKTVKRLRESRFKLQD
ncbi:hypothetical protein LARI1_G009523 [Lachnellula arida]|uniref:Reverse transcriptase domain-containing protein n=1 Tax=Lachnellula arida TaxID=1316785 RepID=A0A8T9B431_9HELO|nr:hypothetical protein LARI1_G009523 [Lachnellula arida]